MEQVNTAVSQMDKVTQQNAAGAEESASAAEELAAQAASVKAMVRDLVALVGGKAARQLDSTAEPATEQRKPGRHFAKLTERLAHRGKSPVQQESGEARPRSGGVAGLEQVEAGSRPGADAPDRRGESGADLDSF